MRSAMMNEDSTDFPSTRPEPRGAWPAIKNAATHAAHIWIPCLILLLLAAPSVPSLLPATRDYLDEIYQPMQALKFFSSRGHAFHKYGPLPNFILAPGYAASLAYWKFTGSFGHPSGDYPYGLQHPFEQIGFLILQDRLIFLFLGLIAFGYLAHTLRLIAPSRVGVAFALLFVLVTNYSIVYALPTARPDSPMLAFAALAIAVYIRILTLGLTIRRGIWLSIWAVCAISSKELAGPMFILPYLGLIALAWHETRRQPGKEKYAIRAIIASIVTGLIAYALFNVVYAPHTWIERMQFWISGPGIDAEVWGGGGARSRLVGTLAVMLNNLGPGGAIIVPIALLALLYARRKHWLMLLLPAISVFLLGLMKIKYPADRFYTLFCLALFPAVAVGFSVIFKGLTHQRRAAFIAVLIVLGAANVLFATFSWDELHGTFEAMIEEHARAHVGADESVAIFDTYPANPGAGRLDHEGFHQDPRSIQQLVAQRTNLPQWMYASDGELQFVEDARKLPARARMLKNESGFDITKWHGPESLGYRADRTLVPQTPAWFCFDWMPAVREWKHMHTVRVYQFDRAVASNH